MTTVAVSMVKDEADIVATTVAHMCTEVDHVIVADNLSTDRTRSILDALPVTVIDDCEVAYNQSAKMTRLAGLAREMFGAEWIVPFDADEVWYSSIGRIADVLAEQPRYVKVAVAGLWDHVPTGHDLPSDCPVRQIGWRNVDQAPLHKVACRWSPDMTIGMGNHNVTYTYADAPPVIDGVLKIRHFPNRSPAQFVRKVRNGAAAYAASDLGAEFGVHWRSYGQILDQSGEDVLVDEVFRRWFYRDDPTVPVEVDGVRLPDLVYDPAPIGFST